MTTGCGGYEPDDAERTLQYGQYFEQHPNWPRQTSNQPYAAEWTGQTSGDRPGPSGPYRAANWTAPGPLWPPTPAPSAPAQPRRGSRVAWTGLGLAAVAAIVATVLANLQLRSPVPIPPGTGPPVASTAAPAASTETATSVATEIETTISSTELQGLLLTADEVSKLIAVGNLTVHNEAQKPYGDTTDREDCGSVVAPGLRQGYGGSGFTAFRSRDVVDGPDFMVVVTQAVSTFASEQKAQEFVRTEAKRWPDCKYKQVTLRYPGSSDAAYLIRNPVFDGQVLTTSMSVVNVRSGCQHTLTSKRNVAIDVRICTDRGSAQAPDLAAQIAARIPTA